METRTVYLAVYDTLADWETGYAVVQINAPQFQSGPSRYRVRTVGFSTTAPVTTMGGVRMLPDLALADLHPEDAAMLILPGADLWDTGDKLAPFAQAARRFLNAGVPVAAICGATAGLAREGLLNDRTHTSAVADYLAATGYQGGAHYAEADAVTDGDLITAGPTEPVAFAREILARLDVYTPEVRDAWFRLFRHSDASAFPVLMGAAE